MPVMKFKFAQNFPNVPVILIPSVQFQKFCTIVTALNPLTWPTPKLGIPISTTEQPANMLQNFVPVASVKS